MLVLFSFAKQLSIVHIAKKTIISWINVMLNIPILLLPLTLLNLQPNAEEEEEEALIKKLKELEKKIK